MVGMVVTRPEEHPYNTCFRSRHPEFPLFVPAEIAESEVVPGIVEDVDSTEPAPPDVNSSAPLP